MGKLSPPTIESFMVSSVWAEITERLKVQSNTSLRKALDFQNGNGESRAHEAGWHKALEMVLSLPNQLLEENANPQNAIPRLRNSEAKNAAH